MWLSFVNARKIWNLEFTLYKSLQCFHHFLCYLVGKSLIRNHWASCIYLYLFVILQACQQYLSKFSTSDSVLTQCAVGFLQQVLASAKEDKRKGHTGWSKLKMYSFVKKKKKTDRDATKAYFKLSFKRHNIMLKICSKSSTFKRYI